MKSTSTTVVVTLLTLFILATDARDTRSSADSVRSHDFLLSEDFQNAVRDSPTGSKAKEASVPAPPNPKPHAPAHDPKSNGNLRGSGGASGPDSPWNSTYIKELRRDHMLQEPVFLIDSAPTRELVGRSTWNLLHTIASTIEEENMDDMRTFITALSNVFPCSECRSHFQETLLRPKVKNSLEHVKTQGDAILWVWNLHNEVNKNVDRAQMWPTDVDHSNLDQVMDAVLTRWSEDYAREKFQGKLSQSLP